MPTPAERQALLFLAGIIVLGAGVRVVRAARDDRADDAAARHALTRQLAAVDSAREAPGVARRSRARGKGSRSGGRTTARAPDSLSDARAGARSAADPTVPIVPIDLDVATESDIETLPRIGPVLARRIVDDRMQNGAFGSIEGFERVRGVGPALAAALRARVTFSGTARPSNAVVDHRLRSPTPTSKSPRRERRP